MAVKGGEGEESRPLDEESDAASADAPPGLEFELAELLRIMPRVFRGLRQGPREAQSDAEPGAPEAGLKALLASGKLGKRHIPVLAMLVLEGPMSVSDLARHIGLGVPAVSLMVGELARAGIVVRREDETDRRRTMVSIDEEHRLQLAPMIEGRVAPLRRALERMPPEVRAAFVVGWQLLADEIDRR